MKKLKCDFCTNESIPYRGDKEPPKNWKTIEISIGYKRIKEIDLCPHCVISQNLSQLDQRTPQDELYELLIDIVDSHQEGG